MLSKSEQTIADLRKQILELEKQVLKEKAPPLIDKYLHTYNGKNLKYGMEEEGLWQVFGEDPNCDLGGPHHEPELGFFSGKFKDVLAMAVSLPAFWSWGGGGRIRKVSGVKHV